VLAALLAGALLLALLPGPLAAQATGQRQMVTIGADFERDLVVTAKAFGTHGPAFELANIRIRGSWLVQGLDARDIGTRGVNYVRQYTQIYPADRLRIEFTITSVEIEIIDRGASGAGRPGTYNTGTDNSYAEVSVTRVQLRPMDASPPWLEGLQLQGGFDIAFSESDRSMAARVVFPDDPLPLTTLAYSHPQYIDLQVYGDHRHYRRGVQDLAHDDLLLHEFRVMELHVAFDSPDLPPRQQAAAAPDGGATSAPTTESPRQQVAPGPNGDERSLTGLVLAGLAVVVGGAAVVLIKALAGKGGGEAALAAEPRAQPAPRDDGAEWVTYPDGTEQFTHPDGSVETYYPDGRAVIHEPDGTVIERGADDMLIVHYPDGSVETHYPDGSAVKHDPDGVISERTPDDIATVHYPDGTYTRVYPDGSIEYTETDGFYRVTNAEGELVRVGDTEGLTVVDLHPDGTATLHTKYGGSVRYDPSKGSFINSIIEGTIHLDDQGSTLGRTGDLIRIEMPSEEILREIDLSTGEVILQDREARLVGNFNTGEFDMRSVDGSYMTLDREGNVRYHDAVEGLTAEMDAADGSLTVTNREGDRLELRGDTLVVNDVAWTKGADGSNSATLDDGRTITLHPDGGYSVVSPQGDRGVVRADGSATVTFADGIVEHYGADGTATRTHPDGRMEQIEPSGER
jgi:hypothetical protein